MKPLEPANPAATVWGMGIKTQKTLSIATALAALAGGTLGVGTAGAQERSSSIDQFVQMSSSLFSNPAGQQPAGTGLMVPLAEGATQLPNDQVQPALDTTLRAKNNDKVTVDFRSDGTLTYNDGCNTGNSTYQVDTTGRLRVGDLNETRMACPPGAEVAANDLKTILRAGPAVFQVDPSTLALAAQGQSVEFVKLPVRVVD